MRKGADRICRVVWFFASLSLVAGCDLFNSPEEPVDDKGLLLEENLAHSGTPLAPRIAWNSEGDALFFVRENAGYDLIRASIPGGELSTLYRFGSEPEQIRVSENANAVFFSDIGGRLFRYNIDLSFVDFLQDGIYPEFDVSSSGFSVLYTEAYGRFKLINLGLPGGTVMHYGGLVMKYYSGANLIIHGIDGQEVSVSDMGSGNTVNLWKTGDRNSEDRVWSPLNDVVWTGSSLLGALHDGTTRLYVRNFSDGTDLQVAQLDGEDNPFYLSSGISADGSRAASWVPVHCFEKSNAAPGGCKRMHLQLVLTRIENGSARVITEGIYESVPGAPFVAPKGDAVVYEYSGRLYLALP